jgi:DMSO/TMAO reductase YedYZ molybdopterin-dependent catalytic subunit
MLSRRQLIRSAGGGAVALGTATLGAGLPVPRVAFGAGGQPRLDPALSEGTKQEAVLEALEGKAPLIKLSYRPPNYETPVSYFDQLYTPNEAFFVRYHLAGIPEVDAAAWRLRVGGEAAGKPFELTLDQLKRDFEPVELVAVCQCSGNRRGLFQPHVPGVQWGYGAMGNARWKGARLKHILERAGVSKEALEVVLDGADGPVLDKTPDFVKSIPIWKALDENTLVAYEMNGQPLPHFNGSPARIIVPGWTATYWVKHITSIQAIGRPFDGFWIKSAYRIPTGKFPLVQRFASQETETSTPIGEMVVNSLMTNLTEGQNLRAGEPVEVRGVAWDGGYGIRTVQVSSDGGETWSDATLGEDAGRFSFRPWGFRFVPPKAGRYTMVASASNRVGQTQTAELILNPAGYHHNVMHRVTLTAT